MSEWLIGGPENAVPCTCTLRRLCYNVWKRGRSKALRKGTVDIELPGRFGTAILLFRSSNRVEHYAQR